MAPQISITEERHPQVHLWQTASFLLNCAEREEEHSDYLLLCSLLMSFLAYEAFVNSCGFILCPDLWKEERENFSGIGIEGKLEAISVKLGPHFSWDKGIAPYQKVRDLEKFRDMAVHAKATINQYEAERKNDGSHFRFAQEWDPFLTLEGVTDSRRAILSFCQSIVVASREVSDHLHLNFDAFEGSGILATGKSEPEWSPF